jgi:hypothetical protein
MVQRTKRPKKHCHVMLIVICYVNDMHMIWRQMLYHTSVKVNIGGQVILTAFIFPGASAMANIMSYQQKVGSERQH